MTSGLKIILNNCSCNSFFAPAPRKLSICRQALISKRSSINVWACWIAIHIRMVLCAREIEARRRKEIILHEQGVNQVTIDGTPWTICVTGDWKISLRWGHLLNGGCWEAHRDYLNLDNARVRLLLIVGDKKIELNPFNEEVYESRPVQWNR